MNEWQRSFVGKLETAKKHWLSRFERMAEETLEPVLQEFAAFTGSHGFAATAPSCEAGMRLYKFGLTENGYVLLTFRLQGLESMEASAEIVVPGAGQTDIESAPCPMADVDRDWVHGRFRHALDRFVGAFAEASEADLELVGA